jgi:SOS-response transcriptional repressor LexA
MGKYYRTPAELFESSDHTKGKIYSCIESLCRNKGYCWASNSFLAKKIGLKNPGNISNSIQELKREGWIKIKINENKRKIWILRDYYGRTINPIQNNEDKTCEIPKDSIIKSNIKSTKELNNRKRYNNIKKGLMDNSKFP